MTLSRADLWSLEEYAQERAGFREKVLAHKKSRQLALGAHARLYFEDTLTIKYQIQEMLRIERVFEAEGIHEELDAYNPLIPDGHNWKATFMIEYTDPAERAVRLGELIGIEDVTWLQVEGFDKIFAIADEDLERETADKTSSVHFMRYELTPAMITAAKKGAKIFAGIDHDNYRIDAFEVADNIRNSLVADLNEAAIN
ncbi:Hypothetical protein i Rubrerythrin cluster [Aequoribacter fuscus]|jgi:hypothetical protein|uniref:Uncharacterized protein n=1 Tax=Aequoribacter fuscus TaxID=2518989 RepID=F3KZ51_9GAMM|nr:DUF3501 family protein [Aequoribacter fuscus]EGG30538.1 Hypothetical protein i Rubrerythrin cluster [Aequoribacter fuscus]QHJ87441.1 DUF3501 family protein [Aequoribacter fuscus]